MVAVPEYPALNAFFMPFSSSILNRSLKLRSQITVIALIIIPGFEHFDPPLMSQNIVCTFANNIDQDQTALLKNGVEQGQTAPFGAVCLGSSLFS